MDAKTMDGVAMKVEELMWAKKIVPLPRIQFPCSGVISAAKYLQQGQHIGKVVLKLPTKEEGGAFKDELFSDTGLYLITGGFGGIGIEIAKWMVRKGARHLALCGRNPPKELVSNTAEMLKAWGAETVKAMLFDVGNAEECRKHVTQLVTEFPKTKLKGIMHAAGVLSDAVLTNQTFEKFQATLNPKWTGTLVLHQLSLELGLPLDYFVMFSSIAALVGTLGQANHTVANAVMDAIAWHRYSLGLSATTVNWGQWGQVGVAADIKVFGFEAFSPESAIDKLEKALLNKETQVAITSDMRQIPGMFGWAQETYFNEGTKVKRSVKVDNSGAELDILKNWRKTEGTKERAALVRNHVSSTVRSLLQLDSNEFLDMSVSLHQLGLDSLMMIQLKSKMVKELEPLGYPSSIKLANSDSVTVIADGIFKALEGNEGSGEVEETYDYSQLIQEDSKLPEQFPKTVATFPAGETVRTVLLTGATGHLGIFMLHMLCGRESIDRVHCLVRRHKKTSGIQRLKDLMNKYGLDEIDWAKVSVIEGVLTQVQLGLDSKLYSHLTATVDGVIHSAAKINHIEVYRKPCTERNSEGDTLRSVNVLGLLRMLELACAGKAKKFYFASTFLASREPDAVTNRMNESWGGDEEFNNCVNLGYATSKFIGEKILKAAVERGLVAYVFRLPAIGGDTKKGVIHNVQENHLVLRFMSYLQTGVIPKLPTPVILLPVDVCSKWSLEVFLSQEMETAEGGVFNVMNPKPNRETDFLPLAKEEFGVSLKLVEFDDYVKELKRLGDKSVMMPLLDFYEKHKILEYLTGSPLYPAWLQNEKDYFKSDKLSRFLGDKYLEIEKPLEILMRDLLGAKKEFEKFQILIKQ